MNYRYRVDDADIILSEEEDQKVKSDINSGKSISFLRNDTLAINVNFIRYIKETDQPTEHQEKKYLESLALPPERRPDNINLLKGYVPQASNNIRGIYKGMQKAIDPCDRICADCGQIHYISEGKEVCLPCLHKRFVSTGK